jgi:HSP20 family protein
MAIMRFDPAKGFETISKKMNDFVNEFEKGFSFEYGGFAPRIDIVEDEKNLFVQAELAGLKKEDVKVKINDEGVLCISGEKKRDSKIDSSDGSTQIIRIERAYGAFNRSFMLPDNINKDSIKAKFENGILEISLEKKEPEKPKEVQVEIQ